MGLFVFYTKGMTMLVRAQRGSVLIYILIAIALIGALTAVFMQPASQQNRSQNSFRLAAELNGQVNLIRAAVQDCLLQFPEGDSSIAEVGYHTPYPLNPNSMHLPDASPAIRAPNREVAYLRCPGNNPGGAARAEHREMFGAASGRFMPQTPALMDAWTYYNGTGATVEGATLSGVYFETGSMASDAYVGEAMARVAEQYGACEAQYIVGNGSNSCANGRHCLRIWLKRVAPAC